MPGSLSDALPEGGPEVVPEGQIEGRVGALRHPVDHVMRLDDESGRWYILHPSSCLAEHPDRATLVDCEYTVAALETDLSDWPTGRPLVVDARSLRWGRWAKGGPRIERWLEYRS